MFFTKMEIIFSRTFKDSFPKVRVLQAREFREVLSLKTENAMKHCKRNIYVIE